MDQSLGLLGACLAAGRSCSQHLAEATDAWAASEPMQAGLDAAESALGRARAQVSALRHSLPGHSKLVRVADRCAERAAEAISAVRALPLGHGTPLTPQLLTDEDEEELEEDEVHAHEVVESAQGALRRAIKAAEDFRAAAA